MTYTWNDSSLNNHAFAKVEFFLILNEMVSLFMCSLSFLISVNKFDSEILAEYKTVNSH